MSIETYSSFTYGHTVTDDNKYLDFNEGAGEISAVLVVGSYSLGEYIGIVSNAINDSGTQEYTVSLDRSTRKITISAASSFDLLVSTGTNAGVSAFPLMGFTGTDVSGTSLEGDSASGEYYEPQNILQSYIDFEDYAITTNASVNQSASGKVEVVSYGQVNFMECRIEPITDTAKINGIKDDANAASNFREFYRYITTKAPIEFIPDLDTPSTFTKCLLESNQESKTGVDRKIKPYKRLFRWFASGVLTFRELD